ncbi:MAG: histone deacetylase [Deltaproteobacteria bacterium]|nr:histone deacetylase [Deltaproteobacteria bacterium]
MARRKAKTGGNFRTALVHGKVFLRHDTGFDHPESAVRLQSMYAGIKNARLLSQVLSAAPRKTGKKWLLAAHDAEYVERFRRACKNGTRLFDHPDNVINRHSFDVALMAVGGVLTACDLVMRERVRNAFCMVRPPGHHAGRASALGFCFFNNVAVAALYLRKKWGLARVAVADIDVHHGSGTQQLFEEDPSVFYYSIHQHPSFTFPGTGREFERGRGPGTGFTLNSPMSPGSGDEDYVKALNRDLVPAMKSFKPDFFLVSTGFDAHKNDEMADMALTDCGYARVFGIIKNLADELCHGRLVSVLEGGYCLPCLSRLGPDHVRILLEQIP